MNTPCSNALLEAALAGDLPPADETALQRHLEECEICSAALERMAGGPALCQEAAALLPQDNLDSAPLARDEWSEVDFTVEHLEPADEPGILGRLGEYDILEVVGHGGMGVVLKGFDRQLKRCVAIKVLAPHLAHSSLAKERFAREAQAAAAVVHHNVLAIHQVQATGRLPFLVMPLVAGESLAERIAAKGTLELKEVLRIGMQAAAGLAAAHEQGLVHRDVKPANILLEKGIERAVLTDFGLARAADDATFTRWGIVAGTPQYMSPEQVRGEQLDGRSDLFSLGCVLYEMASGVSPFRTGSMMATMRRLVDDPPQSLASLNPELPSWFIAIVDRLLEKDPTRRFDSAREVSELLEGCLAHVQQPAIVSLPSGLPRQAAGRVWRLPSFTRFKGVLAMIGALGITLFGLFMFTADPPDIAGDWTGDEWGRVALKKTTDGEYQGTYSDTFGKEQGVIQLTWSRIERRFNGTWREGKERFGEISVRLVDREIRGAFTTDVRSKINPGTPHLVDLAWTRFDASSAASRVDSGPLSHRVPFELGATLLAGGDQITIDEVRGTADSMKAGNRYEIKGTYRLASRDKAMLAVYVTGEGKDATDRQPSDAPTVERGEGRFSLVLHMSYDGKPHVSFYPVDGGEGFGHVYFGTGDSVLKRGWWKSPPARVRVLPPKASGAARRWIYPFRTSISVSKLALSDDAKQIVVTDEKSTVQILNGTNGKLVITLPLTTLDEDALLAETKRGPPSEVKALAFSPDGKSIAVGTSVGQVKLFNALTGELISSLDDEAARLKDNKTPNKFKSLKRALGGVTALAFSPDGRVLVTAGKAIGEESLVFDAIERELTLSVTGPGRLKVWDVKTGALKYDLVGHDSHLNAIAVSPDGHWLASVGSWTDGKHGSGAIIWNLQTGDKARAITNSDNGGTWSVAFSPDGKLLAIGSISFDKDKDHDAATTFLSITRAGSGIVEWRKSIPRWTTVKGFSPDGKTVVVLCQDHNVALIDSQTGQNQQTIASLAGRTIFDLEIAPRGSKLVVGGKRFDADGGWIEIGDFNDPPADDNAKE